MKVRLASMLLPFLLAGMAKAEGGAGWDALFDGRLKTPVSAAASPNETQVAALVKRVQAVLTPDLLKPEWRARNSKKNPLAGHCYAASEALYHLLGGKAAGWTPMVVRHEGGTHWFLRHASGMIVDPTAGQFKTPVPYGKARGTGFLTRQPSKRAREIIRRLGAETPGN